MNKECDFLFLSDGEQSFLMRSLKDSLDNAGMHTEKCSVKLAELAENEFMPRFFIADAEILLAHQDARVYLFDHCIETNSKVILIGYDNTIKSLQDVSGANVIAKSFVRPINNNEITEKLKAMMLEHKGEGAKHRILVVDDSPSFLRLISEWLEHEYRVNVCPSATAAFHMIETSKPELILLDYEMPICNGAQFLQMLRGEPSTAKIPVMFLTSKDDAETVKSLVMLHPQGYLLKNQSRANTLQAIAQFFAKEKK